MTRCVVLVAVSVLAVLLISPAGASVDLMELDDGQHLATDEAAQEMRQHGETTVTIESIQLTVTVAADADGVNAPGWQMSDFRRFIRVDYNESIPRTVRLHINEDVVPPRPSKGTTPIDADGPVADFVVPADGHQSMTIHLSGQTHAVYGLSNVNGELWSIREAVSSVWSNATGVTLPTLGGGEWQHVPPEKLEGTSPTYQIPDSETVQNPTIQYDSSGDWLTVPECQSESPVCQLERDNLTVLFASASDPPAVRYKLKPDAMADFRSAWSDLASIPGDVVDTFSDFIGGGT